jgi:LDH2 family malate/lactate/ureidoglycolate dehydrogenase
MSNDIRLTKAELTGFASAIFAAAGTEPRMARQWADAVVWANLRGVDSHGVIRIPRYVDLLKKKSINPTPNMRIERRAGAIAVLDADRAPGAVGMTRAMDEAIACAREVHVGWCAAKTIGHAGAVGYFALQAAHAGMAGIVMTASGPLMAYHGARVAGVSTNPIAIAVPAKTRRPLLLDMSTSTVANGKVLAARDRGEAVPTGWGIDAEGRDTTDPKKIATLLPLGGPKGSGLSLMIECLASLAVGSPLISLALAGGLAEDPFLNGIAIAIDLKAIGDPDAFAQEVDRLGDAITGLPRAAGVERILLPGERGDAILAEREQNGIPVPAGTWRRLVAAAQGLGVKAPG